LRLVPRLAFRCTLSRCEWIGRRVIRIAATRIILVNVGDRCEIRLGITLLLRAREATIVLGATCEGSLSTSHFFCGFVPRLAFRFTLSRCEWIGRRVILIAATRISGVNVGNRCEILFGITLLLHAREATIVLGATCGESSLRANHFFFGLVPRLAFRFTLSRCEWVGRRVIRIAATRISHVNVGNRCEILFGIALVLLASECCWITRGTTAENSSGTSQACGIFCVALLASR